MDHQQITNGHQDARRKKQSLLYFWFLIYNWQVNPFHSILSLDNPQTKIDQGLRGA